MMCESLEELCKLFQRLSKEEEENLVGENGVRIFDKDLLLEDVENFDTFLKKTGGHTGGWSEGDHTAFVNLARKHNLHGVIYLLRLSFPDITQEEIIRHYRWYEKYVKLKVMQRKAVKFWRLQKTEEEEETRTCTPSSSASSGSNRSSTGKMSPQRREELKMKIQEWKEQKQKAKETEERQNKDETKKLAEKEKLKRIKQKRKRELIMEYKREKIQIQKALRTAKTNEETKKQKSRIRMANKMLCTYRAKDKRLVERVQNSKKALSAKEHEKRAMAEQLAERFRRKIPVARDPVRVHNWTFEWRQKVKYDDGGGGGVHHAEDIYFFKEPLSITNIPHLAVPSWKRAHK